MNDEIKEILNADSSFILKPRYKEEVLKVAFLGNYALNKEKNAKKLNLKI